MFFIYFFSKIVHINFKTNSPKLNFDSKRHNKTNSFKKKTIFKKVNILFNKVPTQQNRNFVIFPSQDVKEPSTV